jgi:hypothetical protein
MRDRPVVPPPTVPFPDWKDPSGVPAPAVPYPEGWDPSAGPHPATPYAAVRDPSGGPPGPVSLPELLGPAAPAPPAHPRGSRLVKGLARAVLWSLIAVGALRGLIPVPDLLATQAADPREDRQVAAARSRDGNRPAASGAARSGNGAAASADAADGTGGAGAPASLDDRRATATAAAVAVAVAFLREYLTVGDDPEARAERLDQFSMAGADLRRSLVVPAGVTQYADLVVAAGSAPVAGGTEVTVLAHVLQLRSGAYRDGGTLAFVVPLAVRREEIAIAGPPRPTSLPVASGLSLPRQGPAPPALPAEARRIARQAVVALLKGDTPTLAHLGGGRAPSTRPIPSGWRALSVGAAEAAGQPGAAAVMAGPPGGLAATVPVRARPPAGSATYLVPVRVQLDTGPRGLTVRQVDAGASP